MENELSINIVDTAIEKESKEEECIELKNIKYKTMLMKGAPVRETKSSSNLNTLEQFLEDEKNNSKVESWTKLDNTVKTKKLLFFAEKYKQEKELTPEEEELLVVFLKDCLNKKKISRVKDVVYDKDTGTIKEIPALVYVKASKKFTLKNMDKRVSTLKSLPPKKTGTIKNHQPILEK
jgi:hypothetical protein